MSQYDVLTIGNAIVDILHRSTEADLARLGVEKSAMTLVDAERSRQIYEALGPSVEMSGGSAANTVAGLVSLGGTGAYMGKVADDQFGGIFAHDVRSLGVRYETAPLVGGAPTARCVILVTPDGERSMNTYLGACVELGPEDIDAELVRRASVTYFEGYLWDPPRAKEAIVQAAAVAHRSGNKVAMTLSDSFCVHRYRAEFLELMRSGTVDIVFANEAETLALYETDDLDAAITRFGRDTQLAIVTRSEKGCVVVEGESHRAHEATHVETVVDTTGAGDLFASGFLYGFTHGFDHADSARLGAIAAGSIISQMGPRPLQPLRGLPAAARLLQR